MEAVIYNQKGKEAGKVNLPEDVFSLEWNGDLVHQVFTSMMSNLRAGTAHSKDRSDVRGGGKKPWRQKGTGRARHGSSRSPIWRGGGVTFGPTSERNFTKKINHKMGVKALHVALAQKMRDGEILFVDSLGLSEPKTKEAKGVLESLSKVEGFDELLSKKKNSVFIALEGDNENMELGFRNFNNLDFGRTENINLLDIVGSKYLVITDPQNSIDFLVNKGK
ncbi:50S ribosomal protein L4 [Patescibacteria group bacterium]